MMKRCIDRLKHRVGQRIKTPYAWFVVLWLTGFLAVLTVSMFVKLLIYILGKSVN